MIFFIFLPPVVNTWGNVPLFNICFRKIGLFPDFAYCDHTTLGKSSQAMEYFSEETTKKAPIRQLFCGFFIAKPLLYAILKAA